MAKPANEDPDQARIDFYCNLNKFCYKKIWEIYIFKEFLDEVHTDDEIFFLLHCRHILLKESQLNDKSTTFIILNYVSVRSIEALVRFQLKGMSEFDVDMILNKIHPKSKGTTSQPAVESVDIYYSLRIILEFYMLEKQHKILIMREQWRTWNQKYSENIQNPESVGDHFKSHFSYSNFSKFIDRNFYGQISEHQKVRCYRKAFTFGNGLIEFPSF